MRQNHKLRGRQISLLVKAPNNMAAIIKGFTVIVYNNSQLIFLKIK